MLFFSKKRNPIGSDFFVEFISGSQLVICVNLRLFEKHIAIGFLRENDGDIFIIEPKHIGKIRARATGFEPAISCVTGRHFNQAKLRPRFT